MQDIIPYCFYCGSHDLAIQYKNLFHPFQSSHGPFNFYKCLDCGSGLTFPLPTSEDLTALYKNFDRGMIPSIREIRDKYSLTKWFQQCMGHALQWVEKKPENSEFNWMDVGAGSGELVSMMMERFPASKGCALDFHPLPESLKKYNDLNWLMTDLNEKGFGTKIQNKNIDLVFSITVIEHIRRPDQFVDDLLEPIRSGGCLYLAAPNLSSVAAKILKRKWPYFIPGEHLHIPSITGLKLLLERSCSEKFEKNQFVITVKPTVLPYPLGYFLQYFGLSFMSKVLPKHWAPRIQTGMLEAIVQVRHQRNMV